MCMQVFLHAHDKHTLRPWRYAIEPIALCCFANPLEFHSSKPYGVGVIAYLCFDLFFILQFAMCDTLRRVELDMFQIAGPPTGSHNHKVARTVARHRTNDKNIKEE